MKHFFFPNKLESNCITLNDIFTNCINKKDSTEDERLKGIYDVVDMIYDKRLEKKDTELGELLKAEKEGIYEFLSDYKENAEINSPRISALKTLWNCVEDWYRNFNSQNGCKDTTLILYHLVRGNICIRISEIYYEDYDLEQSDIWGGRAIEILWHGKNLADNYRDNSLRENSPNLEEPDLYLRIIKLNLAKYYRNYAGKNRRSDFDAALDEFEHIKKRVEEEITKAHPKYTRQYMLIWMDAIFNIARIHREKYQLEIASKETLYIFYQLKKIMQENETSYEDFSKLIDATNKLAEKEPEDGDFLSVPPTGEDFLYLYNDSFDKDNNLNPYDVARYFLLVLLDLSQIRRYLHSVENYSKALFTSIIADQWSKKMDRNSENNIDALNIISSSLRKLIKFENEKDKINKLLQEITITIDAEPQSLYINNKIVPLQSLVKKLYEYAEDGHLKSKIEVIKWYCLYQQYPKLLECIKSEKNEDELIQKLLKSGGNDDNQKNGQNTNQDSKQNLQLRFLQGLVHLRKKEYKKAIDILEDLIDPKNKVTQYIRLGTIGLKTRYTLANCYMSLAQYEKAEVILKLLHDTLEAARKSREGQKGGEDAAKEPRVEIDLAYCYMQRGAYKRAFAIYKELFRKGGTDDFDFDFKKVKRERRIMGLNNFAACSIFSINEESDIMDIDEELDRIIEKPDDTDEKTKRAFEELKSIMYKIETARKIFNYLDTSSDAERDDPETNLLKGYYTLCVGIEPQQSEITLEQVKICRFITMQKYADNRNDAIIKAHKYFENACRFETGFTERYVLQREGMTKDAARCRNEVERVSAYIINLIKLHNLEMKGVDIHKGLFRQDNIGENSPKRNIQRLILGFPKNYDISLKAAIALAEWLLTYEKKYQDDKLTDQMFRSFSYVTIYKERGARVFNHLQDNEKFRFFTAVQRGRFLALLLAMYKPIKAIKEECCFNLKDKESTPHLVHYTSIGSLKNIFADENSSAPQFRINNCGYMNDVFEGKTLLNCIKLIALDNQHNDPHADPLNPSPDGTQKEAEFIEFIRKYFPQIDRLHEDMLPSGSDVYIGSMSVKEDSFPLWSIYAEKERGCNIEFGDGFFSINGTPYYPKALRDYLLSQYTDQDYPLYIVQYIESKFINKFSKYVESNKLEEVDFEIEDAVGHIQDCKTRAIKYEHLFRLLQQIYNRWKELDECLPDTQSEEEVINASKKVIRAFAADRINEIRFLFKDADYEFEGEVRIVYTDYADKPISNTSTEQKVPRVYVDMKREIKEVSVRLGSRIEDATVDKYVTWLKHTKPVKKVDLSKRNRYTHQAKANDLI